MALAAILADPTGRVPSYGTIAWPGASPRTGSANVAFRKPSRFAGVVLVDDRLRAAFRPDRREAGRRLRLVRRRGDGAAPQSRLLLREMPFTHVCVG